MVTDTDAWHDDEEAGTPACQACGIPFVKHLGIIGTCAEVQRLRLVEAEHRKLIGILKDPAAVHANMLHGTIAWKPELLKHIIGDYFNKPANPNENEN